MAQKVKLYLASSWRNEHQPRVLAALREAGHEVYDFKNPGPGDVGFGWRQITSDKLDTASKLRSVLAHPIAQRGFDNDFRAMRWADGCVLLLPCGNSAHLEAGWFAGRERHVVVLAPELREPELMYKCFDGYGGTPLFETVDEVLAEIGSWSEDLIRFRRTRDRQ